MSEWDHLDVLGEFLLSDAVPDNSMGLSDLDGFLTGILVGPELIMPSEWLPHVWDGEEPIFESTEQAQEILGAIMKRYNDIVRSLDGHPDELNPIFWQSVEGDVVIADDWAEGFLEAIDLRREAWMPLVRDTMAGILLMPILALCGDKKGDPLLPIDPETGAEIAAKVPGMIPVCVFAIRDFWRERVNQSAQSEYLFKVGRNDPCSCGSGRTYKKCCGAN